MWWHRLRWYLQIRSGRQAGGLNRLRTGGMFPVLLLLVIGTAGLAILRTIWSVLFKGFLGSTPFVPGSQVGTYYWNSAMFAFKSTLVIGVVLLLVMFFLGYQVSRFLKR